MRKKLPEKAVAINSLVKEPVSIEQCVTAFRDGFAKSLQIELKPFTLSEEQLKYVHELAEKNMRMMIGTLKSKMWYKKNIFSSFKPCNGKQ